MGKSALAALAAIAIAAASLPLPANGVTAPGRTIEFTWSASFGTSGSGGSATVRVFAARDGAVVLNLRGLAARRTYVVGLYRGSCPASGTRLIALGSATASSSGRISRTIALRPTQVTTLYGAAIGISRVSLRIGSGATARCAVLRKSLTATPRIWFAPLPPMPIREGRPYIGSTDFAALFADDALWRRAAGRTHVFKLYGEWLGGTATAADLRRVVSALQRRGIAIAIEAGPLIATDCGEGVEGFAGGAAEALRLIRKVEAAGGTVRFVAMDEPYFFASLYTGPNACRWSREKVAGEVVAFVRAVQRARPGIIIGDIEPLPFGVAESDYEAWMAAYRAAAGAPLPFFHLDLDWGRPDWVSAARALQAYAGANGVRFGMIYFGNHDDPSDAAWVGHAWERLAEFELGGGRPPGDAIFQSWQDKPDRVLPETGAATFTRLIVDYTRVRTLLRVDEAVTDSGGGPALPGSLATLGEVPIAGAAIGGQTTPLDGPYQVLELTGRVPSNATTAVIGVRVNHEDAGPGSADLTFYQFTYSEGMESANRVPNPRFDQGLDGWGWWGTGGLTTTMSDRGGLMLRITATPEQYVGLNSQGFAVTAGAEYRLTVALRVPGSSVGSAYAAPIFLGDTEIRRDRLPLAPRPIPLAAVNADSNGTALVPLAGLEGGRYQVRLTYAGDRSRWPAWAERTVTVQ